MLRLTRPDRTMLEEAVERLAPAVDKVHISTSQALAELLSGAGVVSPEDVLAEPEKRNTLGALVWVVAALVARGDAGATVAVVTADHAIGEPDRFRDVVRAALEAAETTGGLVTIGVPPDRPETGYGYIERSSEALDLPSGGRAYMASGFREKPDPELAQNYLESGNFLWNAGMFFFTVPGFRAALAKAQPEAATILDEVADDLAQGGDGRSAFARLNSISFDYAVMEKADAVHVVESDFPWDDVGAWDSLDRTKPLDPAGNVIEGPAAVLDAQNCVVVNDSGLPVGVCGVENVVVVVTEHGVLVCRKEDAQRVREVGRAARAAIQP